MAEQRNAGVEEPKSPKGRIAIAIAAACAIAAPLIMKSEGLRTKPYRDPVSIQTVCYGETNVPMRVYSKDECGALLRKQLARKYAPKVLQCIPQLAALERRNEFAALIDSSYNAGPVAVCKSRMATHFRAGRWVTGCNSLEGWYTTARDRRTGRRIRLRGLVIRRHEAKLLCLRPE